MTTLVRFILAHAMLAVVTGCGQGSTGTGLDAAALGGDDGAAPMPDAGPSSPLGGACTVHTDCSEGHCAYVVGGDFQTFAAICTGACSVQAPVCGQGTCFIPGDVYGTCVPECGVGAECGDGLGCDEAAGQCLPSQCERLPPAGGDSGCCFDNIDCGGGMMCHGARCEDDLPGRCLPVPDSGQCWTDADCAPPAQQSIGRCVEAEVPDLACTDEVTSPGQPGNCVTP